MARTTWGLSNDSEAEVWKLPPVLTKARSTYRPPPKSRDVSEPIRGREARTRRAVLQTSTLSEAITMATSHSHLVETPEAIDSSFARVLHADGPDEDRAPKLALFAWMVGQWDMDVTTMPEDGTTHRGHGEILAGWVLQGRAIQDVQNRIRGVVPCAGSSARSRRIRFIGPASVPRTSGTGGAKSTSARGALVEIRIAKRRIADRLISPLSIR